MFRSKDWKYLKSKGYRVTSVKNGIVSRIDRADWKQVMIDSRSPVDADQYRRCVSQDKVNVTAAAAKKIGNSSFSDVGYVAITSQY